MKEGTSQTKGRDAIRNNVEAAKLVAAILKPVLGPRGMDKMLVDSLGDVTITNDGATILKEMDVQHPAAKIMVEIAKTVDEEVGDGTTSSVIIAGAMLEKAEELLIKKGIHPTIIVDGYRKAMRMSIEILNKIAEDVNINDHAVLKDIAKTSMESKIVSVDSDVLADLAVKAILTVAEKADGANGDNYMVADLDNVKVQKKAGESMGESSLIEGIIVDKEITHSEMPKRIENARILLLNSGLEIEKTEFDAKISIDRPEQMKMFLEEETRMIKAMVDKIAAVKANVVFCQKGIDDIGLHYLTKANISAVRRVKESDLDALAKATGARVVTNIDDLSPDDLGYAQLVEEKKVELDKWVFVEKCRNPKAVSVLIRGGSQRIVDEAERSIHDALMVVKDVVQKPAIVVGGGSPEAYVAQRLREWAPSVSGREHFAILAFADAIESIPVTLIENAGMDTIDTITQIRSKQSATSLWMGVDVKEMKVTDMRKKNVIEPLAVKEQVLKSATEAAAMLLRIDDILAASPTPAAGQSSTK
ncbi:archaeal thermosome [Candidatus Nitrososphaera gargensis Ga9.2]|uniref:Archaeal thermosome n=1 Tax=Nitrososphaera gargensis (strain Ga9.2) TaxID=1237085 RepID=K0IKK1_NITGG|nr:archaeal thermosome [Candidatus Nitrososphaera gargensis Ga9.2]